MIPPIETETNAILRRKLLLEGKAPRIKKGLIFWTVKRRNKLLHDNPWTTRGSHAWKGAAPILIKSLTLAQTNVMLIGINSPTSMIKALMIKKTDPNVWVKKYVTADFLCSCPEDVIIRGMKDIELSSNAIQHAINDGEDIIIKVLRETMPINNKLEGDKNIIKKITF